MKFKHLLTATALMLSISVVAQPQAKEEAKDEEGFKFTTIKELPVTSVKDQNQAGTCWCYSSLAFFEAELLRTFTRPLSTALKPLSVPTATSPSRKVVPSVTCCMPSSTTASSPTS